MRRDNSRTITLAIAGAMMSMQPMRVAQNGEIIEVHTSHMEMDHQLEMEALHRRSRNNSSKYRPSNETSESRPAARRRKQMIKQMIERAMPIIAAFEQDLARIHAGSRAH